MALWKRGKRYWTRFAGPTGEMFHKPLRPPGQSRATTSWQEAVKLEKEMIKEALEGKLTPKAGPKRLFTACDAFLAAKRTVANRERTADFLVERLDRVKKILGDILLVKITRETIEGYQAKRKLDGVSNRTVNMEVGALRQVLKRYKHWRRLEDDVVMLTERGGPPIGRALTNEEEERLMHVAQSHPEWEHVWCAAQLAANTSLRGVELKHLRRKDVDLRGAELRVCHSKNETSYRRIPLNEPALAAVRRMMARADLLGHVDPEHYLWCGMKVKLLARAEWIKTFDPTKPAVSWGNTWRALAKEAGLKGFRFHDLRHTVITRLLEAGEPDHVVESITGHLSKAMLQHYSHIRMKAKREALDRLDAARRSGCGGPLRCVPRHARLDLDLLRRRVRSPRPVRPEDTPDHHSVSQLKRFR